MEAWRGGRQAAAVEPLQKVLTGRRGGLVISLIMSWVITEWDKCIDYFVNKVQYD